MFPSTVQHAKLRSDCSTAVLHGRRSQESVRVLGGTAFRAPSHLQCSLMGADARQRDAGDVDSHRPGTRVITGTLLHPCGLEATTARELLAVLPKHYELLTVCAKIELMNNNEKIMPWRSLSFTGKSCLFFVAALFLLFAPAARTANTGDVRITFVHWQRSLQPGEVVFIEARSSQPLKSMQVEAFKRKFPAFGEPNGMAWAALVGIDLGTAAGRHGMVLRGAGMDGKDVTATGSLLVKSKSFPSRRLMVEEKYVIPPANEMSRIEDESKRVNAIFGAITPAKIWNGSFRAPVPGSAISAFGKRNVYNGEPRNPHSGVDFRGASGTPIRAPNAGRVALASSLYFSGNTIILDHGLGLYSYLAHLSEFSVREGDLVEGGDIIGKVGATGRVTGPHLHWTVRLATALVDPLSLIGILKAPQ